MLLTDNLVAYYKLQNFNDELATYNLVNTGATIIGGGKLGSGASLSSDYFRSPYVLQNVGAVSVWFKYDSFSDAMVIGATTIGVSDYLRIRPFSDTQVQFTVKDDNVTATVASLGTTWHHAVITWDTSTAWSGYLDGVLVATGAGVRDPNFPNSIPFGVLANGAGIWSSPFYFNGTLDEIGIWNRRLILSDVTQLWNGGNGLTHPFAIASASAFMPLLQML